MRVQRLELRLTEQERAAGEAASAAVGETLSDFFRRAAGERASDILAQERRITLSAQEAFRFLDALDRVDQDTVARLARLRQRP